MHATFDTKPRDFAQVWFATRAVLRGADPYALIGPLAIWGVLIIGGSWLLHPILTPAHVEGFSASIVSLALHLNAGSLADYDRLYPANLEYFALSRLGTIAFVSVLTGTLGLSGEVAVRVTMWIGFAALSVSSFVLVRRWTNASPAAIIAALLLIPGLGESAAFYNDNVLAAALVTSALAVVASFPSSLAATFASGLLFGAGIVARIDAVLLAPAIALIGYEQHGLRGRFVRHAVAFSAGVLVPVTLVPAAFHATIFDVLRMTRYAIGLWNAPFSLAPHARELSLFLGIPAAILAALGVYGLMVRREYARLVLLLGVPLLFNIVALGKIWQSRQLLALTPFLAALVLRGWQHIEFQASKGERTLRRVVVGITCLVMLAPIMLIRLSDGPRAPYGRMWSPVLWKRWQRAVSANQAEIRTLVTALPNAPTAILTDTWDGDRYLHLALQESGYRVRPPDRADGPCGRVAEVLERGDQRVIHIRLHQPFLSAWRSFAAERLRAFGEPCLVEMRPTSIYLLTPSVRLKWALDETTDSALQAIRGRSASIITQAGYSPQIALRLNPLLLVKLRQNYVADAAREATTIAGRGRASVDLARAERLMAAQVWRADADSP